VCFEIEVEPYVEHMDNLMDVIVMVVLIVVLHISASEQYYAGSAVGYGIVMLIVVLVVGVCLALMTKSLSRHQKKHAQMVQCNQLRAKAHRTQKGAHNFDADGDGELDREELIQLFDKLDANGDGKVSQKELSVLIRGHKLYMVVADVAEVHAQAKPNSGSEAIGTFAKGMVVTALEEVVIDGFTRVRIGGKDEGGPWMDRITSDGKIVLEELLAEEELQVTIGNNLANVGQVEPAQAVASAAGRDFEPTSEPHKDVQQVGNTELTPQTESGHKAKFASPPPAEGEPPSNDTALSRPS